MYLKLRSILHDNRIYYSLLIISCIIVIFFTKIVHYESKYNGDEKEFNLKVVDYEIYDNKIVLELKGKEKLVGTYYFNNKTHNYNVELGDIINVKGTLVNVSKNTNFNAFNYNKYLYNKKIFYKLKINSFNIIRSNNNIFYSIKNLIINHIEKYNYSKKYLYVFILGNKNVLSDNVINSYNTNGISHLFSISGMHISILLSVLYTILKKVKRSYKSIIVILMLLIYMFITSYSSSVIRAGVFTCLSIINKYYKLDVKLHNILYIELFILIIINPFIIYGIGFQFSFVTSLSLIKSKKVISKNKNKLYQMFTISFVAFLSSLPICIYNFNQISIISIINNLFFVPLITIIVFPLSLITFVTPYFDYVLYIITLLVENISLGMSNIKFFVLILAKVNILIILFYYMIIILVIKYLYRNYLYLWMLILCLFIHNNISYFNLNPYYIMIDVGQGDSSLLVLPNNSSNILIDTGGSIFSDYDIADKTLIPLFKSLGIKKIDYLILTHGDYDHMG